MGNGGFHVEAMSLEQLREVIGWAQAEGWETGMHDAEAFYSIDPDGFFAGVLDGELVASVSALIYDKRYAFMGLYLVKEKHRGKGYGKAIWDAAMSYLEKRGVACAGLDGVIEQVGNYEKSGFVSAYDNVRFVYEVDGSEKGLPTVFGVTGDVVPQLAKLDAMLSPEERAGFCEKWLGIMGTGAVYWSDHMHGDVRGYAALREGKTGYRLGPWYAHDVTVAAELFEGAAHWAGVGRRLFVDVPGCHEEGLRLMESRGAKRIGEFRRMYKGGQPSVDVKQIFGERSVEVG